jgi:hypothetical protein
MRDFNSRMIAGIVVGGMIAATIATWSAPSDARVRGVGATTHSVRHGFHVRSYGLHVRPFVHNSYPRGVSNYAPSVSGYRPYGSYVPYGSFCSVTSHRPCLPEINYPIGQDLQLTIESHADNEMGETPEEQSNGDRAGRDLDTIRQVFSALRACWNPPAKDVAQAGTQMTVRLSFNRYGSMISEPRVTYVTPDISSDVRQVYRDAVTDTFKRCTPLPFTDGLGGALAGRPFAIRFVDNRSF